MYKIRSVEFIEHPILKNLVLDFCDINGNAVSSIIFAGENGNGKSTILNEIYNNISQNQISNMIIEIEVNNQCLKLNYQKLTQNSYRIDAYDMEEKKIEFNNCELCAIFSDVDINFHSKSVSSVTSMTLDEENMSRRSTSDLPTKINQLIIDIQALDDADVAYAARKNPNSTVKELNVEERMPRFTEAFSKVFDNLSYNRVENRNGNKVIFFNKNGVDVPIDNLSSGEKQIVYRGCFLLKDVNALKGAFVFLDEPEISLHPIWQMKIMDYYKSIFTNKEGVQTSQIFAVTHSPFVIHSDNRRDDKVIVLARNEMGDIVVKYKPEYFKCSSSEVVKDAFSIQNFYPEKSNVYLEGRTDEKYFNKALEVFGYNVMFDFRWVGYIKDNGQEENTGKDALNKASQFLISRNLPQKNICLFDCDTNKIPIVKNNVYVITIPQYNNSKKMKKGIENALVLDNIDTEDFYSEKTKIGDYGDDSIIKEFRKMDFCNYICSLDDEILKGVFSNLRTQIDKIIEIMNS